MYLGVKQNKGNDVLKKRPFPGSVMNELSPPLLLFFVPAIKINHYCLRLDICAALKARTSEESVREREREREKAAPPLSRFSAPAAGTAAAIRAHSLDGLAL